MNNQKFSFLIICTFFIIGIYVNTGIISFINLFKTFTCILLIMVFCIKLKFYKTCSILVYIEMFIIGTIFVKVNNAQKKYNYILRDVEGYICTSETTKDLNNNYTNIKFIVLRFKKNNVWYNVNDLIYINLIIKNNNGNKHTILYGDTYFVNNTPRLISNKKSKKSDAFYKYYTRQGIYYNQFINYSNMVYIGNYPTSYIKNFFETIKMSIKPKALKNITSENSKSIISNILFGKGDTIEKNLKESYSKSGIIHILAISGLHIGLLFFILSSILSHVIKNKNINSIFSLSLSWIYGGIISFPPSVIRTLLMLTFYKISELSDRHNYKYSFIFNSLIISLIINPNWLYSVGFQLSYLATFGIIFLQKDITQYINRKIHKLTNILLLLYRKRFRQSTIKPQIYINTNNTNKSILITIKKKLVSPYLYIINSVATFISVNLYVFPVLLYNFNYINLFSIFSNIIILLILPIIIFFGMMLIIFCWTTYINLYISLLLSFVVKLMNNIIIKISKIETLTFYFNGLTVETIFVYYIIINLVIFYIKNKNTNVITQE